MRRTIYFLVAVLLCFISLPYVQAQVVGSIPGQFNVGSSGAASYTIPIDCPAGINGMQPNISLVYNSQSGDGPLGVGWGIGGLSSVSRTTSNLFSDGAVSGLDLSSELFSLDGNRLFVDQHVDLPAYSGAYTYREGWKPGGKPKPDTDPPSTPDFWGDLPTTCGSTCQSIVGSTYYSENKTYQKIESFGVLHMYAESIEFAGYFDNSVADQKFYTKSWSKIPAGPGLFRITSKNGTVIEYGAISVAADANNQISSPPLTWYVSKITDANGNCQTYSYQLQGKQMVIKKIDYSSNGNAASFASIEFNYVVKSQKNTTYILGSTIDDLLLLKDIQLKVNGTLIKQYVLSYDTQNNKYFLNNIALVGVNSEQLNSTVIAWGDNNNVISTLTAGIPSAGKTDRSLFATDVDGDGFSDLIDLYNGAGSVSSVDIYKGGLSINGQTPLSSKLSYPCTLASRYDFKQFNDRGADGGFLFCDFKGNGKKTILVPDYNEAGNVGNVTFRDIQSGQQINQVLSSKSGLTAFAKGDINNDGIDEIVSIEKTASTTGVFKGKVYYVTKAVSADNQLGAADQIAGYDFGPGGGMAGGAAATPKDLFIADFNGDGLNDLLVTTNAGCFLYMNNGGSKSGGLTRVSFTRVATVTGFNSSCSTIKPGDFNGDGLTDFIINEHNTGTWKLAINNGTWGFDYQTLSGFTAVEEANTTRNDDKEDCIVTDFNHDGKSDVVLVDAVYNSSGAFVQTNINWYASTGVNFTVAKTVTTTDENYSFSKYNCTGDFDGDGREEVLSYGSDIYNGGNKSDLVFIQRAFNANSEAYQIKSITDGLGKKTEISYQPLTYTTADNRAFYTKGSGATYPVADVQTPLYCVSKVSEPDGLGALNTTEFAYSGAQAQLTGRGFLGFKSRTISNATTNRKIVNTTDMNLSYYLPDKTTTEVSAVNGGAVSKTETNYSNTASGKTLLSLPAKTVEYDYLNDLTKTTDYVSFDAYGNATNVKTTQGDLVSTQTSTYVQKGGWCPNKPETVTITRQQGGNSFTRSKSYTYDDNGNLTKETTDPGDANQLSVEYKDRNAFGQSTKTQTTANGLVRTASIAFTPSGRFIQSKTDVLGQTTTYSWDETRGLLNSETSRQGTTIYTYNGLGQLTNTAYPDGTHKSQTAQWASTGNTFGAKFYITQQASGMAASYTWFDALQREVVREGSGLNGKVSRIFTQYRADGKTYRVSQPTFDTQATAWDAVYDYYPEGRLKTVTTPVGTTTSTYNGKTTTVASPEGTQATTLNAAGQTATSTVNGKTVTYAYYASGKAQTATPDGGAAVAMEYDLQGNRTKLTDPDAGVSSAGYNGYGELKWEKQTNNAAQGEISTTYNYNATTGQIESRVRNGEITSYGYDTYRRLGTVEIAGQDKQTYTYGDYDRVTKLTELIGGTKTLAKGLEYDAYGRVNKETFPSGYYTVNNYDSYGNLNEVTDKYSRSIWKATEANARGQITRLSKGIKETVYGYDEAKGQLTSMAAAGVVNYSYSYDVKNNPEYRSDNLLGQKEHFSYDAQNRLTNWDIMNSANTVLKPNSLTYNATTGNIATKSDLGNFTMNYGEGNGKPHALTTVMGKPDVISASDLNVTYSDFRKIKNLTEGSKQYTITYGVDDQRRISVQTQGAASVTKYYLGNYEEETDNLGNVKKIHYLSGGSQLVNMNGVETLYYGYTDNQGSLVALTDASGNVVEKYAYDPWGARRNPNDWTQKDSRTSWLSNRGYTGHEHLDLFNIINMNGRVYDPLTAQFYSPDPFIQSGSDWKNYNRYSYCMNNPTRYTDPSGYKFTGEKTSDCDRPLDSWGGSSFSQGFVFKSSFKNNSYTYIDMGEYSYYADSKGKRADYSEVQNNYILPNAAYYFSGQSAQTAFSYLEDGFNLYSIKFSSGYTSYAASIGDIGEATMGSNGALTFSNRTVGMISPGMWGGVGNSKGGGGGLDLAANVMGNIDFSYNMWLDATPKASGGAKGVGIGATGLSIILGGLQVYDQYTKGGIRNIKPVDGISVAAGTTGIWAKVMSVFGFGGKFTSLIGNVAGEVAYPIAIFQAWYNVYKPIDDLRFAPSYFDQEGKPIYGDPTEGDWR